MVTESRSAKEGGQRKKRVGERVDGSGRGRLGTCEAGEERGGKAPQKSRQWGEEGFGLELEGDEEPFWKAGWEVCFMQENHLEGMDKIPVPTAVCSPPGLSLESKNFTVSITLVQSNKHEK